MLWCPTSKGQLFFDVVFGMNQVVHFTDNDICEVGLVLVKQFNYVECQWRRRTFYMLQTMPKSNLCQHIMSCCDVEMI